MEHRGTPGGALQQEEAIFQRVQAIAERDPTDHQHYQDADK
jgi:hypothetical protein